MIIYACDQHGVYQTIPAIMPCPSLSSLCKRRLREKIIRITQCSYIILLHHILALIIITILKLHCLFPFYLINFHIEIASMQRARSSELITTLSLAKSRDMLDKITHKISMIESNRQNSKVIQSIQHSSKKIQQNLQSKIEENFNQLMQTPTLMPLAFLKTQPKEKQNQIHSSFSAVDGAKALMHNYWQRNKKSNHDFANKDAISKTIQIKRSQKLPEIHSFTRDNKIAAYIKIKEKEKQLGMGHRVEEPLEEFHISIKISDYKCQNDGKDFLKFQKRYYKRWEEIEFILKSLQKFAQHYKLASVVVKTFEIFDLIERVRRGEKINPHHLLNCCEDAEAISTENYKKAGIRFFGNKGMHRAVVKIQSHARKFFEVKKYKVSIKRWRSAKTIQAQFRCFMLYKSTKQRIFERQMAKITKFKEIQTKFIQNFRKREISSRVRYEIHVPSHNLEDWQKISSENYLEKENGQLCRIFKIAQTTHLTETHIIYVSPIHLSKDLLNYYRKLLQLGAEEKIDHRLTIISPEYDSKFPINISLTQQFYYSSKTIKKIKALIQGKYAYIVPSTPSNDYIHLCNELNIPLYGSDPQKLLYMSTKAGCKAIQQSITESKEEGFGILPYSVDIYTESSLLNELTNLIYRYPYVKRWVLKIDNQHYSRGVAYIDVSKIIGKSLLQKVGEQNIKTNQQKQYRQEIYNILENILIANKQERIVPIDKQSYPSQADYLRYFYTRGGIIEASINNFESDLENTCFTVNIEPDGQWKFVCNYYKITNKNKAVASYFDSACIKPPIQINDLVSNLKTKKLFGYFTFQFLSIAERQQKTMKKLDNKLFYLNSIECHLNSYSAAYFLKQFISKDSNALFIPILQHPCIKELRLQTFFHLCRLQNISFDIQKKIGNVFMFLNGLESGCLGIMTFNPQSKEECFTHTAEVLDFLNSKLKQTTTKNVPESFFALKNAVNGFLNRSKRVKLNRSQKMLDNHI